MSDTLLSYGLCLSRDDFIIDKCVWMATLMDGTKVWQDDNRPGVELTSAWKRLGLYVADYPENKIRKMVLRFGTHVVGTPEDKPFYFYSHGFMQAMSTTKAGVKLHVVGWPNDAQQVHCYWYRTPELTVMQQKIRTVESCQPEQLIGDLTNFVETV